MQLLSPSAAQEKIGEATTVLVDIRSRDEYIAEHIENAVNMHLDDIKNNDYSDKTVIFYCLSGARTYKFEKILEEIPTKSAFIMKDGLTGWKMAGYPTVKSCHSPIPLMQQVQIAISLFLLISLFLTYIISPWFSLIILFIAIGLMIAGITGFCGLAVLLSKMPWNKVRQ